MARFLAKTSIAMQMKFILYLCQKGVDLGLYSCTIDELWFSEIFIHNGQTFGQYSCTFTQVFIPYWNFEYTKAVTLHCGKSERWYRLRFCNWSDSSWAKSTSIVFSVEFCCNTKFLSVMNTSSIILVSALHAWYLRHLAISFWVLVHFYHIFTGFCDKCVEISWRSSSSSPTT